MKHTLSLFGCNHEARITSNLGSAWISGIYDAVPYITVTLVDPESVGKRPLQGSEMIGSTAEALQEHDELQYPQWIYSSPPAKYNVRDDIRHALAPDLDGQAEGEFMSLRQQVLSVYIREPQPRFSAVHNPGFHLLYPTTIPPECLDRLQTPVRTYTHTKCLAYPDPSLRRCLPFRL